MYTFAAATVGSSHRDSLSLPSLKRFTLGRCGFDFLGPRVWFDRQTHVHLMRTFVYGLGSFAREE